MKKMNLPNRLTVLRMLMVPLVVLFALADFGFAGQKYITVLLFALASITDLLDGKIARKYNLVTNFGKFMDPLADKLLVTSSLMCLSSVGKIPVAVVIIIIAREFIISGFRLIAAEQGVVLAASIWGKAKTAVTMVTIILLMLDFPGAFFDVLELIMVYLSLILTVVSLIDYLKQNWYILMEDEKDED